MPKPKANIKDLLSKYRLLSDLMKYIPDVIYFKDKAGRLIMVNEAHAKGLGLTPEKVVGKTDFDIFGKERAALMAKDDEYVMSKGKAIIDKIERSTRADGVDNYVSTTKIPRYDEWGRIVGLIGITRDITRRMLLEHVREEKEAVEKKLQAAEELNRIKSEFVSVVSHELRTPLAIIKEAVMLLLDGITGDINDKQREVLAKAENSVRRLKGIIEDLLDVARIETGRLKLHYSLVNLNDLLKDGADFFKKQARDKGISLEYALPKEQVNIFLDHNRINQVIANLITNALKFTEEDGSIRIELKELEDKVRLCFEDTGIGIAKADAARLFNKFTQVANNSQAQSKGVGLGLSIAKELVNAHGGQIWVESKLGVGSKFYFTLPRLRGLSVLDLPVRSRINHLLSQGLTLYFVNLLIVNYQVIKVKMRIAPSALFENIEIIINMVFDKFCREKEEKPQVVLLDKYYGECAYLLPGLTEKETEKINLDILERLTRYLYQNKVQNVFINVGVANFPEEAPDALNDGQTVSANLRIKKILIGPEIRRFERINYSLDTRILMPKDEELSSQTVDISKGGIAFYSPRPIKTDARVDLALRMPNQDKPLMLKSQTAWIKEISNEDVRRYKIGLEFIGLKDGEKKIISGFLKSLKPEGYGAASNSRSHKDEKKKGSH